MEENQSTVQSESTVTQDSTASSTGQENTSSQEVTQEPKVETQAESLPQGNEKPNESTPGDDINNSENPGEEGLSKRQQKRISQLQKKHGNVKPLIDRIKGTAKARDEVSEIFDDTLPPKKYGYAQNAKDNTPKDQIQEDADSVELTEDDLEDVVDKRVEQKLKEKETREQYVNTVNDWEKDFLDTITNTPELNPENKDFDPVFDQLVNEYLERVNQVYDAVNDKTYYMPRYKLSEIVSSQKKLIAKYGEKVAKQKLAESTQRIGEIAASAAIPPTAGANPAVDYTNLSSQDLWNGADQIYKDLKAKHGRS